MNRHGTGALGAIRWTRWGWLITLTGMNLEDHLGDIVHKARDAADLSLEEVAEVAGLSSADLSMLEESGASNPGINYVALGRVLRLDGKKLEKIAQGWTPQEHDLGQWRELRQITTIRSGNAVHCYVVWDEVTREAALFDTGWEARPILDLVEQNKLQVKHLFLTHSHQDHVAALETLRTLFPKMLLHTGSRNAPPQHRNRANDFIHLGSLRITNRETPGHAEDGVTYVIGTWPEDAPHVAMVGDAIFAGSIGRGFVSWEVAKQKVREQIFSLPRETLICPGHGPVTTVAEEKAHNPFFP